MDREIPKEVRNKERNKKIIRYGAIGVAGIVVVSVLISLMRTGVKEKDLVFSKVGKGTIEVSVSASGKVVPAFEEIINSPINTRILEVYRKGGDSVDVGTPILKLDLQSAETDYKKMLDEEQMRLAYGFIYGFPGAPFLYYGDEIGMRYLPLPTKEGGYFRTGSRTPMQWDDTANHGFSTADAQDIYLPVDTAADAPTVAAQADDPDSLLNSVKSLLAFRHAHADLNADAPFKVLYAPKAKDDYRPFVWQRGDLICAVNPAGVSIELPLELAEDLKIQYTIGQAEIVNDTLSLGAQSFVILG